MRFRQQRQTVHCGHCNVMAPLIAIVSVVSPGKVYLLRDLYDKEKKVKEKRRMGESERKKIIVHFQVRDNKENWQLNE